MMDSKLENQLISAARTARENAYAPYSGYKVGAAVLTARGKIYTGANFENAAFGAGTCAERVALGAALAAGEREFVAVACVGADVSITPCGICRQALAEFGDMDVICAGENGEIRKYRLSELLPHSFSM